MEPNHVLRHRSLKALTPYIPDAWEAWLRRTGLYHKYPTIPDGLRAGFAVGLSNPAQSFTPPNNPSIEEFAHIFEETVNKEIAKGRYIGPFDLNTIENLLGPIQTAPLSLVPKPGKPGKFRLVQNLSFPHKPSPSGISSVNSRVDPDRFPTQYSTFQITCLLISYLPPGSQAAVRDVAEAYRTVPSHPSQWPSLAIRLADNKFAVDTSFCFGFAPSGGIYGKIGEAGTDILRAAGIGPIARWVDDHIFFRIPRRYLSEFNRIRSLIAERITKEGGYRVRGGRSWIAGGKLPNDEIEEFDEDMSSPIQDLSQSSPRTHEDQQFCYNLNDIDKITDQLGIPWEPSKDIPFTLKPTFIGLEWDLSKRMVTLTEAKRIKYVNALMDWRSRRTHSLAEVQKLHGKLLHASLILPAGRAYLTNLEAMIPIFGDTPLMPRTPPRETPEDIAWWINTLSRLPLPSIPISPPSQVADFQAFSDASSGFGIGITIGSRWRAWRLKPGWDTDGRDISWAEGLGFEFLIRAICASCPPGSCFKVLGDNIGVVEGWANGRSRNRKVNHIFRRIHSILQDSKCQAIARYVPSASNPADGPSRGVYPPAHLILPQIPIHRDLLPFVEDCHPNLNPPPSSFTLPPSHSRTKQTP